MDLQTSDKLKWLSNHITNELKYLDLPPGSRLIGRENEMALLQKFVSFAQDRGTHSM